MPSSYNFEGITGLTTSDRELWEKQNYDILYSKGYFNAPDDEKIKGFQNAFFKHKYGNNANYKSKLKNLDPSLKAQIINGNITIEQALNEQKGINTIQSLLSEADRNKSNQRISNRDKREALQTGYNVDSNTTYGQLQAMRTQHGESNISQQKLDSTDRTVIMEELFPHLNGPQTLKQLQNFKDLASKVSPHYQRYQNTDYLKLSDEEWKYLATEYVARERSTGQQDAINYLENELAKNVARNMGPWEKLWRGFQGMFYSIAGAAVTTVGMLNSLLNPVEQMSNVVKAWNSDGNFLQAYISNALDNDLTRYGNDITRYGTLSKSRMEWIKQHGGISDVAVENADSNGAFDFIAGYLGEGISSQGFTVLTMLTSFGTGALVKGVTGLIAKIMMALAAKSGKSMMAIRPALTNLQKASNAIMRYGVPAGSGTSEAIMEGLNTKITVEEDGRRLIDQKYAGFINDYINDKYENILVRTGSGDFESGSNFSVQTKYKNKETGEIKTYQEVMDEATNHYADEYQQSLRQLQVDADAAAANNFIFNQTINGIINMTLKGALQSKPVQDALRESKVLKPFQKYRGDFKVTGKGADVEVTPKMGKAKVILNTLREPIGEGLEEYAQNISDAVATAGAMNNIEEFVNAKFNGDTSIQVGDTFASDWWAAWSGFTENIASEESFHAGVMGALGSVLGTPTRVRSASRGYKTDAAGNPILDKKGRPKLDRVWFGRGIKADGKQESWFDVAARLTPWRSSVVSAYRRDKEELSAMDEKAQAIQEWLRDPTNQAKWDGVVGTYSWAGKMQVAADANDEFSYRNSHLGKLINDIFMLDAIKGSEQYNTIMERLNEVANLEEGSELAQGYVQQMRDDVNVDTEGKTDSEILAQLKKNANDMLQTYDDVQTATKQVESLFGSIDEDAKQALVYSRLAEKDWAKREEQLLEEVDEIKKDVTNSSRERSKYSELNKKQKKLLDKQGSLAAAQKTIDETHKKIEALEEDIEKLKAKKNKSKAQEKTLKEKEAKVKTLKKSIAEDEKVLKSMPKVTYEETQDDGTVVTQERDMTDEDLILNEEEIMELDPVTRANVLLRGAAKRYNAVHGEQSNEAESNKEANNQTNNQTDNQANTEESNQTSNESNQNSNEAERSTENSSSNESEKSNEANNEEESSVSKAQREVVEKLVEQIGDEGLTKLVDLGRIHKAREKGAKTFASVVSNYNGLSQYISLQKQIAAREHLKRKYKYLGDIEDYKEFKKEMDNIFRNGTMQERMTVRLMMSQSKNPLWQKYNQQRQTVQDINKQLDKTKGIKNMSFNDLQLLNAMSEFLFDNEVDMSNPDKVIEALSAINQETGNSAFIDYMNKFNQDRETPIKLDNYQAVVSTYKEAITKMGENQKARTKINTPAPQTEGKSQPKNSSESGNTSENSNENNSSQAETNESSQQPNQNQRSNQPQQPNQGQEINQDQEANQGQNGNQSQAQQDENQEDIEEEQEGQEGIEEEQNQQGSNQSKKNSSEEQSQGQSQNNKEVSDYDILHKKEVLKRIKDKVVKKLRQLNQNSQRFEDFLNSLNTDGMSEEEIIKAIQDKINDKNSDWDTVTKVEAQSALKAINNSADDIENTVQKQLNEQEEASKEQEKEENEDKKEANKFTNDKRSRGIDFIEPEKAFPKSAIARWFKKLGSSEFINRGLVKRIKRVRVGKKGVIKNQPQNVRFYYDPQLAQIVAADMGEKYSQDQIPIVVLYPMTKEEEKEFPNGIKINGVSYMPIGLLPANTNTNADGVEIAKIIRSNIGDTSKAHFIKIGNKVITATPKVFSPALTSSNNAKQDRDVTQDVNAAGDRAVQEAEEETKDNNQELSQEQKSSIRKSAVKAFVNKILKRIQAKQTKAADGSTYTELSYEQPTLKNDGSTTNHFFRVKKLSEIVNAVGKTIQQLFESGESLEGFNSFFTDFAKHLQEQLKNALNSDTGFAGINNTYLNAALQNDIYSSQDQYSLKQNSNGGYSLYLGNEELAEVTVDENGNISIDYKQLFNNLVMPNGSFRENLNLQVNYAAIGEKDKNGNPTNKAYYLFNRAVEAGVLRNGIQDETWERGNRTVGCEIPPGLGKPTPKQKPTKVVNGEQDNDGKRHDQVETPSGEKVDTQTGTNEQGVTPTNPVSDRAKEAQGIVDKIIADSKEIELTENEEEYRDKNGTIYERVTKFIKGVIEKVESIWKIPSTTIGTTIDNFVRDFFELSNQSTSTILKEEEVNSWFEEHEDKDGRTYLKNTKTGKVYYNVTKSQMQNFAKQMIQLHNYFKENGLTVYPNGITVSGVVKTNDGETHNVAGTLDILAVDQNGDFHIFDMKTHIWDSSKLEEHKPQWDKQLSLYKKLLEDKYLQGTTHRVVECAIIPIKVDYATPSKTNTYTVGESGQLQLNDVNYTGTTVSLDLTKHDDGTTSFEPVSVSGELFADPNKAVDNGVVNPDTSASKKDYLGLENPVSSDVPIARETQGEQRSWNSLTGEQKKSLKDKWKIKRAKDAEAKWMQMSAEQQQKELECCG